MSPYFRLTAWQINSFAHP